jgi:murein DD-endopeptidase MepM/ murein hydrolase activator NlpD
MMIARHVFAIGLSVLASGGTAWSQEQVASRDDRITPERLGLPKGSSRTSEPFVTRIYKTDDGGQILKKQPSGYPFTITGPYKLKGDEKPRVHEGVDLSSRPAPGQPPRPLDFRAGVHGVVVRAGGGDWGTIAVQLRDGSVLQYLHTTASHVKVGDIVSPETPLGVTGRTGAGAIHLHVQAKDKYGNALSPDLAFRIGQKRLSSPVEPEEDAGADFDPEQFVGIEPDVVDGVVRKAEPKTKWVSQVIGGGGKVVLVLGEFPTYTDASRCSLEWSEAHPDDLRLTREIEVKIAGGGD